MHKHYVAGVDEAGRGPLAGPVIAAAVILDPARPIQGLADSKQLTAKQRMRLFCEIREKAIAVCAAQASVLEIDHLNILQASLLAMQRAVIGLHVQPKKVLVDGNKLPVLPFPAEAIVRGDETEREISAASIIAKVLRDRIMRIFHYRYPDYDFAQHKGYSTPQHLAALQAYGPSAIHRRSFAPVAACFMQE